MSTIVKANISPELKLQSEQILKQIGLDMSGAIKVFLSQLVIHGGLPFDVRIGQPNLLTMRAIEDSYSGKLETAVSLDALFAEAAR